MRVAAKVPGPEVQQRIGAPSFRKRAAAQAAVATAGVVRHSTRVILEPVRTTQTPPSQPLLLFVETSPAGVKATVTSPSHTVQPPPAPSGSTTSEVDQPPNGGWCGNEPER